MFQFQTEHVSYIKRKNIDSFSEHECFDRFRLRKSDLHRLFPLLKLPVFIKVYAGIGVKRKCCVKLSGEEVFCFSLNRFRSTAEYTQLCSHYGRTYTAWDRAFHYFINHILYFINHRELILYFFSISLEFKNLNETRK